MCVLCITLLENKKLGMLTQFKLYNLKKKKTYTHVNIKTLSPVSNNNNIIVIVLDTEPQHVHKMCEK